MRKKLLRKLIWKKASRSLTWKKKWGRVDKGIHLAQEEDIGKFEQGPSIERLKQAVITITERIDGWFAKCIDNMENIVEL